jgi:hypothetical protein
MTLLTGFIIFAVIGVFPILLGLGFLYIAFTNRIPASSSATPSPLWERIVGGLIGILILVGGISAAGFVSYSLTSQCMAQKGTLEFYMTYDYKPHTNLGCFADEKKIPLDSTFFGENWRIAS